MKFFNKIVFLVSFGVLNGISAMEVVPAKHGRWCVEIDNKVVEYYARGKVRYDGKYRAHKRNTTIMSFDVENTDPLPIEYWGERRFFATSGIPFLTHGGQTRGVFEILDPTVKQLAIVRAVVEHNNTRINVYMGLDTDNVTVSGYKGRDRMYSARVIALQAQEK